MKQIDTLVVTEAAAALRVWLHCSWASSSQIRSTNIRYLHSGQLAKNSSVAEASTGGGQYISRRVDGFILRQLAMHVLTPAMLLFLACQLTAELPCVFLSKLGCTVPAAIETHLKWKIKYIQEQGLQKSPAKHHRTKYLANALNRSSPLLKRKLSSPLKLSF